MCDAVLETLESADARCEVLAEGVDERGPWIRFRHTAWGRGATAGSHWHPVLAERFTVVRGALLITLDGDRRTLVAGGSVDVPARTVHAFTQLVPPGGDVVVEHEVRPPGNHRAMFQVLAALGATGRLTRCGLPRNPLALGLLWGLQDGYVARIPTGLQRLLLGGLDRLARATGFDRRLAVAAGRAPTPGRCGPGRESGPRPCAQPRIAWRRPDVWGGTVPLLVTRAHVDLCRTATALCRR